jgi:hypothetical protein
MIDGLDVAKSAGDLLKNYSSLAHGYG